MRELLLNVALSEDLMRGATRMLQFAPYFVTNKMALLATDRFGVTNKGSLQLWRSFGVFTYEGCWENRHHAKHE